jgi:hypothetical protein
MRLMQKRLNGPFSYEPPQQPEKQLFPEHPDPRPFYQTVLQSDQ